MLLIFVNRKSGDAPYMMVLRCEGYGNEKAAEDFLRAHVGNCTLKGKTVRGAVSELSFEVRLRSEDTGFVAELAAMTGVQSAVLVSYNGDYMG